MNYDPSSTDNVLDTWNYIGDDRDVTDVDELSSHWLGSIKYPAFSVEEIALKLAQKEFTDTEITESYDYF